MRKLPNYHFVISCPTHRLSGVTQQGLVLIVSQPEFINKSDLPTLDFDLVSNPALHFQSQHECASSLQLRTYSNDRMFLHAPLFYSKSKYDCPLNCGLRALESVKT